MLLAISSRAEKQTRDEALLYPILHLEIPFAEYYTLLRILSTSNPLMSESHQRVSSKGINRKTNLKCFRLKFRPYYLKMFFYNQMNIYNNAILRYIIKISA